MKRSARIGALQRASVLLALLIACGCSDDESPNAVADDDAEVEEDRDLPEIIPRDSGPSDSAVGEGDAANDAGNGHDDAGNGQDDAGPQDSGGGPQDDAAIADSGPIDSGGGTACVPIGAIEHEHTSEAPAHIPEPMPASAYNSSPPSSGPHCEAWGEYTKYGAARPLPACNFLHNLEHGAIVLLYNCPEGCPEITDALEDIVANPPTDPDCIKPRLVLTPYDEMDAKLAAVAWGFTWTSDCIDSSARDSLYAFIQAHLGTRGDSPEPTICGSGGFAP